MTTNVEHLELDRIADLQEGLLDEGQATQARAHLADCDQCRSEAAALLDLRARLAAVVTDPMPDDVVARLDAALVDEARAEPTLAEPTLAERRTVTPLRARRPQRQPSSGSRLLSAAAAAALLLAGVAVAVSFLSRSGGNDSTSSTAATKQSGRDDSVSPEAGGRYPVLSSGTDYTAKTVAAAVPRLLSAPATAPSALPQPSSKGQSRADAQASPGASSAAPEGLADRLSGGPALADCLAELTGTSGAQPLAVDLATFDGKPATVILLPTRGDPAKVDVQVVGPGCRQGDAALLNFTRVALP